MHQTEEIMKIASEARTTGLRPYKSDIGPTNIPIMALAARYIPTVRPKVAVDVLK